MEEPSTITAKVCHHDRVKVYWDGILEHGKISCADCQYVFWDNKAPISFSEAMSELLKEYEN